MKFNGASRIWLFYIGFLLGAGILIARLYVLQVVNRAEYADLADRQYVRSQVIFDRGSIFFTDRRGTTVSAANIKNGFILAIDPSRLENAESALAKLKAMVDIDREDFLRKAGKKSDPHEEIMHRLDEPTAKKIKNLALPGVSVYKERWRQYPAGNLAAHAIGLIGFQGDELAGRYGLESYYEDILKRRTTGSGSSFLIDLFSDIRKPFIKNAESEGDIYTALEPTIQGQLEKKLDEIMKRWRPELAGGIIMNPMNGEIISMAVRPSFDPNSFKAEENPRIFSNPLIEGVYEMGSIMKPLTIAAGLDAGAITATTTYNDKGFLILDTKRISNYDGKARGVVSMQEVLNQSLNTGAAFAVRKMGNSVFAKYMNALALGEETGIDLPSEAHGLTENLKSRRDIEYATASYGQGIATTPIATLRALSALANGGVLVRPHVATSINYKIGLSKKVDAELGARVITEKTSEEITRMLVRVVDEALLQGTVKLPRYSVAAKTGTAQIADPKGGGYYDDRALHAFFGYFPAYTPRFLVFLYAIHPKEVRFASETLTYPFMDITKFLLQYYEIPPDR